MHTITIIPYLSTLRIKGVHWSHPDTTRGDEQRSYMFKLIKMLDLQWRIWLAPESCRGCTLHGDSPWRQGGQAVIEQAVPGQDL